ncbi:DUF5684 domain-containing protein [Hymenobacter lucidus]|uniref:DUF5684 domain-containing protein n=1 Tax=Hymenobacter lucidus TaxID=2880930 RepID=A0ABS8AV29_9BACT|nr:DUF5684 domain-containing protein [Hymenobacter lucidus]MCB2410060.1 DUF5684 domain-containing protein [Hymenobacter lucidus]
MEESTAGGLFAGIGGLLYLAFIVLIFAGMWKMFQKAGKPGWAAIIPIYNFIVMHEIVGRETWKFILLFIPLVNIYFFITLYVSLSKSYGKTGIGNYLAMIFFGFIFIPYLGFSSDVRYVGPVEGPTANSLNPAL